MPSWMFWTGMGLIALVGRLFATCKAAHSKAEAEAHVRELTEQRNQVINGPLDGKLNRR